MISDNSYKLFSTQMFNEAFKKDVGQPEGNFTVQELFGFSVPEVFGTLIQDMITEQVFQLPEGQTEAEMKLTPVFIFSGQDGNDFMSPQKDFGKLTFKEFPED